MKLKEAQVLGVLALIAIGIVLLCMWGGQEEEGAGSAAWDDAATAQGTPSAGSLREVYADLLTPGPATQGWQEDIWEPESVIEVGTSHVADAVVPDEESVLRGVIEEEAPEQIAMTPLPADTPATQQAPQPARTVIHTVEKGETLSAISKKYYGTVANWTKIQEANKGTVPDPRKLLPGTKLVIPKPAVLSVERPASAAAPALAASTVRDAGRVHLVAKGDTLWRIAMKYYDDGTRWKEILAANRELVAQETDLKAGMELRIP